MILSVLGSGGDHTISGSAGDDNLMGNDGSADLFGSLGSDQSWCNAEFDTMRDNSPA